MIYKYARQENGVIKKYRNLPNSFYGITGNHAGGFDRKSDEIHKQEGFYPIVEPENPTPKMLKKGNLFFNLNLEQFEYELIPIEPDLTLEIAKSKKINELKQSANSLFQESEWYYHREIRTGKLEELGKRSKKDIPDEILERDNNIYMDVDRIETEINNLTEINDVLEYQITINA